MKPQIRVPYFEVGTKNYVYGDTLLEYAIAADKAAEKYDIDVLFICPAVEIRRVAENTKNLIVLLLTWIHCVPDGAWQTFCPRV